MVNEKDAMTIETCCRTLGIEEGSSIERVVRSPLNALNEINSTADALLAQLEQQSNLAQQDDSGETIWKGFREFRDTVRELKFVPESVQRAADLTVKAENTVKVMSTIANVQGAAREIHRLALPEIGLTTQAIMEARKDKEKAVKLAEIAASYRNQLRELYDLLHKHFQEEEINKKATELILGDAMAEIVRKQPQKAEPEAAEEEEAPEKPAKKKSAFVEV